MMSNLKGNKVSNPTSRRETIPATFPLKECALRYYDTLEPIINDLAQRCTGGEEYSLNYPAGKITIKLK